jgi:hypothetical protein
MAARNYLADSYERHAAAAVSATSLSRNCFAAFLPLASPALKTNLGFGWASLLLGLVGLVLLPAPMLVLLFGWRVRRNGAFRIEERYQGAEGEERRKRWPIRRKGGIAV